MDLSKIRERLAQLNQGDNQKKHIWKPSPGDTTIRIVPYAHNPDWPFLELYFHYEITKKQVLSPVTNGEPDPIEEFAAELRSSGQKEDYFLSKKLSPSMRTYVPILVRGKESEGPKFWGFGKTTYEELLKLLDDPDWGDITSLNEGRDIVVSYEKGNGAEQYAKTTIRPKPMISPASKDKSVLESLENMPKVEDLWPLGKYDELKTALERYLRNLVDDDGTTDQEPEPKKEPEPSKPSSTKSVPKKTAPPTQETEDVETEVSNGFTDRNKLDDEFAEILDSKPTAVGTKQTKTAPKATLDPEAAFDEMFK